MFAPSSFTHGDGIFIDMALKCFIDENLSVEGMKDRPEKVGELKERHGDFFGEERVALLYGKLPRERSSSHARARAKWLPKETAPRPPGTTPQDMPQPLSTRLEEHRPPPTRAATARAEPRVRSRRCSVARRLAPPCTLRTIRRIVEEALNSGLDHAQL